MRKISSFLIKLLFVTTFLLFTKKIEAQTNPNGTVDDNSTGSTISSDLNANLRLWLDATDKSTLYTTPTADPGQSISELESANPGTNYTGTEIQLWLDKSDYHSNVTNSVNFQFPEYVSDGGLTNNNLPTIEFSKSDHDHLTISLPDTDAGNGAKWESDYTVFIVFEQTADGADDDSFFSNGNNPYTDDYFQITVSPVTLNDFVYKANINSNAKYLDFETEKQNELKLYSVRESSVSGLETLVDGVIKDYDGTYTGIGRKFDVYNINKNRNNNRYSDSRITEVIIYDKMLTDCELDEVNKYLGAKYGKDFSSSFSALYNDSINTAYNNTTAGIGLKEDICGDTQDKRNTATSNGMTLTVADADNTVNRNYVVFSDNNGTNTSNDNAPSNFNLKRLNKAWMLQEFGNNALGDNALDFEFDIPSIWSSLTDESFVLLVDDDGDFSDAEPLSGGTVNTGKVTFNNITLGTDTSLDLDDTTPVYIALAMKPTPGGIAPNLTLWLRADTGVTTDTGDSMDQWDDQSGNGHSFIDDDGNEGPDLISGGTNSVFNFNDYLDHGIGSTRSLRDATASGIVGSDAATLFAVFNKSAGNEAVFSAKGNAGDITQLNVNGGYIDDNPFGEFIPGVDAPNDQTILVGLRDDIDDGSQEGIYNGAIDADDALTSGTTNTFANDVARIGTDTTNDFTGKLAEVIVYQSKLSDTDVQKVNSYLALKYGVALDQTSSLDYLASDGTVIWDATANTGYDNDIFGIGRDDASGLNQKVSKSINAGSVLTVALDNNFTAANMDAARTTTHTNDKQFLVIANNGSATSVQITEIDGTNYNTRISREWKVDNTNFGQSINLKFDGFDDSWTLLKDNDGDFSSGASPLGTLDANGEITNVTLSNSDYLTLAKLQKAPGGVINGISLWIKANDQVFSDLGTTNATNNNTIEQWSDQGPYGNNFTQVNIEKPTYLENSLNFNPQVYFDGTTAMDGVSITGLPSSSDARLMRVVATQTGAFTGNHVPFAHGTATQDQAHVIAGSVNSNSLVYGSWEPVNDIASNNFWTLNSPHIVGGGFDGTSTTFLQADGVTLTTDTDGTPPTWNTVNSRIRIGADIADVTGEFWIGNIAEVVEYSANISASDQQKIDSYLAIKYGIALDQISPTDYLASDGSTIWSASDNTGYDNDIFGIGRDDASGLNQKVSKSTNTANGPILSTIQDFASENSDVSRTSLGDGNFLIIGHNNGTENSFTSSFNGGTNNLSDRVWKVDETGMVGSVFFAIPKASYTFPSGIPIIVLSNDTTFNTDDTLVTLFDDGTFLYAQINPADGDYIAMATASPEFTVSQTTLTIDENGGNATFTVVLNVGPTSDVVFDITSNDLNEATVNLAQLTFTSSNWNIPQTITVTGVDDTALGEDTAIITIAINDSSSDDSFDALSDKTVNVTLSDDDISNSVTGTNISSSDGRAISNGVDTETITLQLKNDVGDNLAIAGVDITFYATGSAILSNTTTVTDANGVATITVSNTVEEVVSITSTGDFDNNGGTAQIAVNNGAPLSVVFSSAGSKIYLLEPITNTNINENTAYTSVTPALSGATPIGTVTYTLGGNDAADFTIDGTTGIVSMIARDYENAADANTDNIYELTITATDSDGNSDSESWTVTVDDVTEAANFTIDAISDTNINENTAYTSVTPALSGATPIGTVTYTLGGNDAADFTIDGTTGIVSMIARDYENAADANTDNIYELTITATDSDGNSDSESWTVTVDDVTETVAFTINAISDTNINENTAYTSVTPALSGDTPIGTVTYTLGGNDAADFTIDGTTGIVSMIARDYENPADVNTDNIYELTITATDSDGNSDSESWTVTVDDVTETVAFTINAISDTNINENTAYTSVTPALSGDTPIGTVTYTLGGNDAADFTIDGTTGIVSMIARDYENPADVNTDNVYELTITATDSDGNSDSESWTVTVDDVTETVAFTINAISDTNINENTAYTSVTPALSGDTPIGTVTYTLGGNDAADFTIDGTTGIVSMIARDYENPADVNTDNVYELTITATDSDGNSDSESWTVTVDDVIEAANFTINAISDTNINENTAYTSITPALSGDTPIGTVTYTLGGNDATDFTINPSTGVVSMIARDYENSADANTDNVYELTITATDSDGNSDSESWTVTVDDVTETVAFTIDAISDTNINENTAYTSVTPALSGATPIGTVTYTLGGNDAADFTIDGTTGIVSMIARDYENSADANTDNVYELTITATDSDGNSDSESWTVTVDDVTEAANFTIDAISDTNINENTAYTSVTPALSGATPIGTVTYTLGGNDAADFTIDGTTGIVSMIARDYENPADANTDNVYELTITATDSDGNSDSESWTVTVDDVTETVAFTINAISDTNINENTAYTSVTPALSGATPIGSVTYTLGGNDAADFTIDGTTGIVSMIARDYENPADANTDNIYELTITATDSDGNSDSESWTVTVDDVTETVAFTINAISDTNINENTAYTSVTPALSGATPIGTVTYTLGGNDAADFTIDGTTGIVSMIARDYENPADANTDNIYELTITATDSDGNSDSESWTVTVDDVTETVAFTIDAISDTNINENIAYTSVTPALSGATPIGTVTYTLGGNDAADFTIDGTTGIVSMIARDYENAADANTDNVYELIITATDSDGNSDSESWTVTVNDDGGLEVLTQIGAEGDNPDNIDSVITVLELNTITGLTGVNIDNEVAYQNYIDTNPDDFSTPATLAEVQLMINLVNTSLEIDTFEKVNISMYPNPVISELNITAQVEIINVNVFNTLGQRVLQFKANSKRVKLDLSNISAGMYNVIINTNTKTQSFKIVKE